MEIGENSSRYQNQQLLVTDLIFFLDTLKLTKKHFNYTIFLGSIYHVYHQIILHKETFKCRLCDSSL